MDAIGRFEHNNHFNIWAGRFLPPSDRATFYGPYYANDWAPYADGLAGFYPDAPRAATMEWPTGAISACSKCRSVRSTGSPYHAV